MDAGIKETKEQALKEMELFKTVFDGVRLLLINHIVIIHPFDKFQNIWFSFDFHIACGHFVQLRSDIFQFRMNVLIPQSLQHNTAVVVTRMLFLPEIKLLLRFCKGIGTQSLSDQIQQSSSASHLDMMFIDEGFGSLDSQSRDQAVRVLQQMAGGSKLIGIISHVSELKQEIEDQLIVSKDEEGSSARWQIS